MDDLGPWIVGAIIFVTRVVLPLLEKFRESQQASAEEAARRGQILTKRPPAPTPQAPAPSPRAPAPTPRAPMPSQRAPAPTPRAPMPSQRAPAPTPRAPMPSQRTPAPAPRPPAPAGDVGTEQTARARTQLTSMVARADQLLAKARAQREQVPFGEGPLSLVGEILDDPTIFDLAAARARFKLLQDGLSRDAGWRIWETERGGAFAALALAEARLAILVEAALHRRGERADVMADADAFADALAAPLADFAEAHDLPLPRRTPLCIPTEPGQESMIRGLFRDRPVIFVPRGFGDHIERWASLPHELGHVVWHALPGLRAAMHAIHPTTDEGRLPRIIEGRLIFGLRGAFDGWLEELFCDAFAILLLGPAGLRGMMTALDDPARPDRARYVHPARDGVTLDEHPPAHLRVHLAAMLLHHEGYDVESAALLQEWQAAHGNSESLLLPVIGGQPIEVELGAFLTMGHAVVDRLVAEDFDGFEGWSLRAIPGLEMTPGMWADVKRRAPRLALGESVHSDARVIMAAGIQAAANASATTRELIAKGVRASIAGRGQALSADAHYKGHPHERRVRARSPLRQAREAILLWELLKAPVGARPGARGLPMHGARGPGARPARR